MARRVLTRVLPALVLFACQQAGPESADAVADAVTDAAAQEAEPTATATAQETEPPATPQMLPGLGKIEVVRGIVVLHRGSDALDIAVGDPVELGDRLVTKRDGKVQLRLRDGTILAIGPKSQVSLAQLDLDERNRSGAVDIVGKFWAKISSWSGGGSSSWELRLPQAKARVYGTILSGDSKADRICALDGTVEVFVSEVRKRRRKKSGLDLLAGAQLLEAGQCATQLRKGKIKVQTPGKKKLRKYVDKVLVRDAAD